MLVSRCSEDGHRGRKLSRGGPRAGTPLSANAAILGVPLSPRSGRGWLDGERAGGETGQAAGSRPDSRRASRWHGDVILVEAG